MKYKEFFPILSYYKRVVQPLNPSRYRIKSDKMMVCPLHDDVNPSMGIIISKDGEELFHCFGCNQWGNVVTLHRKVSRRLFKKYLSEEEAVKDLCRTFNVPVDKVVVDEVSNVSDDTRIDLAINSAMEKFDISDFRVMFMEGKLKKKPIGYFNTLTMLMISELKDG